jgi:hypothetical protein
VNCKTYQTTMNCFSWEWISHHNVHAPPAAHAVPASPSVVPLVHPHDTSGRWETSFRSVDCVASLWDDIPLAEFILSLSKGSRTMSASACDAKSTPPTFAKHTRRVPLKGRLFPLAILYQAIGLSHKRWLERSLPL